MQAASASAAAAPIARLAFEVIVAFLQEMVRSEAKLLPPDQAAMTGR
jgi:hypothetical protein